MNLINGLVEDTYGKFTANRGRLNYYLDLRKNITWEKIEPHYKKIVKYLENSLKFKTNFNPVSIKIHNYININNMFEI